MHFISEELENYVRNHSENEPELLKKLNKETYQKVLQPRMLSGHFQGRVLSMLTKLVQPKHVLEIGTYTGYATLCMAEGLAENGTIDTIDVNEELVDFQKNYFDASPWGNQIQQHLGEAIKIIPTIKKNFDFVFIDADKESYIDYFNLIVPLMKKGGVIITDNVLWSGKVLEPIKSNDKATKIIMAYNELLKNDTRVETVLLPIRDGLTVCRVL